ncbi:type I-E CRISPR-associated protein Cas6/Cse3/CasE [Deinococcus soli (ex Cha et al. 2016)]|uniref:CRISPR system Cascade subunit CasE n=2 Tax=Deinococcus soli (ex Cha et al. 2016) TaxID=1309411 RepID=A0AAE3XCS5_9DEIO|nr:type I-E CRISPR-associated protein Cas6/Cse3/CasE [Deinococcus soli (ex Cha et al. 2016)]MDR6218921.1 CRISPR system Cascade subunit CasE [Deinococcus soli (ex Cha et al. 2016)]MDR6328718.1 CRISPR system Cascade subunit CasE [Deinococcus soli (ex Cha et al. 2016)]MDR6751795.1 CRISPR system Cascade subunit CasE [Deinococcus soli (ex Cha et al. 2016)]
MTRIRRVKAAPARPVTPRLHLMQFRLNPASPGARRDLRNRHAMHRTLTWGLPWSGEAVDRPATGDHGRLLWRLINHADSPYPELLVQVPEDLGFDPERLLDSDATADGWGELTGDRYWVPGDLDAGSTLRFDVELNALRRGIEDQRSGRPVTRALIGQAQVVPWLGERADLAGFTLLEGWGMSQTHTLMKSETAQIREGRGIQTTKLVVSRIEGRLRVDDPAVFAQTCAFGLGRGRAFGCGLFLVGRAG